MSHKMKLSFSLNQKLAMTMKLQQSIQMLTLPHQELKEKIEEELLNNPLLEVVESAESDVHSKLSKKSSDLKLSSFSSLAYERKTENHFLDNIIAEEKTLKNHLLWQVQMSPSSPKEKSMLALLISHLNDQGYLDTSLEELAQKDNLSLDQLEMQLKILQGMEPAGVGARSLKECLLIQAQQLQEDTKDMVNLIQNYLHLLESREYEQLALYMNLEKEEVVELHQIIASMEPNPARGFSDTLTVYVTPDVYIYEEEGDYKVALQEEGLPRLQISSSYEKWLQKSSSDKEVKKYMNEKRNDGNWFIKSLIQRQETIRKVCYSVIRHQKDFFDKGPQFLKPLILKDIAEEVGVHRSTISRVTSRKHVHTPHGLVSLKYFFNTGLKNDQGEMIPVDTVKQKIKNLIDKENNLKPLSDQHLSSNIHKEFQLSLSRRTIAQYRYSLGISSIRKRKKTG